VFKLANSLGTGLVSIRKDIYLANPMPVLRFLLVFMILPLVCPSALGADEASIDESAPAPGDALQTPVDGATPESENTPNSNTTDTEEATDDTANTSDTPASIETITIPRVTPDVGLRRIEEVLTYLDLYQSDQQVIKFGDEDTTLSGLYLPENTGRPQGGVLILHDIEQNALWAQTVGPLREYLPDYGWNTLSLFFGNYLQRPLPSPQPEAPEEELSPQIDETNELEPITPISEEDLAEATGETDDGSEPIDQNFVDEPSDSLGELANNIGELPELATTNNEPQPPIEELSIEETFIQDMQLRVEDGLRQLNTLGQFNLVIVAYGLSANWAAASLNERFNGRPGVRGYALVLINARASGYPAVDLNDTLAQLKIPMLDIVTGQSEVEKRQATERRNAITRKQNRRYIQIQLPEVRSSLTGKKNLITRRVRGWLKSNAAGEEVDVTSR